MPHFMDFELDTENSTFCPRFETEILVEKAVALLSATGNVSCILDIGTGCGNIAISLTKYFPFCKIVASDISDTALWIAKKNAARYGVENRIEFIKSDIFTGIPKSYVNLFDLIISNPPYVTLADFSSLPPAVKDEPYSALYGGRDGMLFYRKIIKGAVRFLKKGGILLMEIGYGQAADIKQLLETSGSFRRIEVYKDYNLIERIIKAEIWKN